MADVFERNGYQPAQQPAQQQRQKYFAGHVQAMGRLGVKELRNAMYTGGRDSVADTEMGLYGTVTPAEAGQQQGFQGNYRGQDINPPSQQQDRGHER